MNVPPPRLKNLPTTGMKLLAISFSALLCFFCVGAQPSPDYGFEAYFGEEPDDGGAASSIFVSTEENPLVFNETFVLLPNECDTHVIRGAIPRLYTTTVTVVDFQGPCSPSSLSYTNGFVERGVCFEEDFICPVRGASGVTSKGQLCSLWDSVSTQATSTVQKFRARKCIDGDIFFGFQSACQDPITVNVKIEGVELSFSESTICFEQALNHLEKVLEESKAALGLVPLGFVFAVAAFLMTAIF